MGEVPDAVNRHRHRDEWDQKKSNRIGGLINRHRRGTGQVEGMMADRLQHDVQVGQRESDCRDGKAEKDEPSVRPTSYHHAQGNKERDRLQDVSAVESQGRGVTRRDHDGDSTGDDEEERGECIGRPPLRQAPLSPRFNRKTGDCDQDAGLEQRGGQRTVMPAHRVPRHQGAGERGANQGEWVSVLTGEEQPVHDGRLSR